MLKFIKAFIEFPNNTTSTSSEPVVRKKRQGTINNDQIYKLTNEMELLNNKIRTLYATSKKTLIKEELTGVNIAAKPTKKVDSPLKQFYSS
jgi:hypothetical protein